MCQRLTVKYKVVCLTLVFFSLSILWVSESLSQSVTVEISKSLYDEENGINIYVILETLSSKIEKRIEKQGFVRFEDIKSGLYVVYSKDDSGYFSKPVVVDVSKNEKEYITINRSEYGTPGAAYTGLGRSAGFLNIMNDENKLDYLELETLTNLLLEAGREAPDREDFPDRGSIPFTVNGTPEEVSKDIREYISKLLDRPVRVFSESPFTYIVTWYDIEDHYRYERRYIRSAYMLKVNNSNSGNCSEVYLNWISESCGVREKTWRKTDAEISYTPGMVSKISNTLSEKWSCEQNES